MKKESKHNSIQKKRIETEMIRDFAYLLYTLSKITPFQHLATVERIVFLINYFSLKESGKRIFNHRFYKGTHGLVSIDINDDITEILYSNAFGLDKKGEYIITEKGSDLLKEFNTILDNEYTELIDKYLPLIIMKSEEDIAQEIKSLNHVKLKLKGDLLLA